MDKSILCIEKDACCGCGLCQSVCPQNAISEKQDKGFWYPFVNPEKCTDCGLCTRKCPVTLKTEVQPISSYSFYRTEKAFMKSVSSGGFASALAEYVISKSGVVYGVGYSDNYKEANFVRVTNKNELDVLKGSKYTEPLPPDYKSIKKDVGDGKLVLFVGLPCHVAALRSLLNNKPPINLLLVGLMCLGKSPNQLFVKFTDEMTEKYGADITNINMRWKRFHGYSSYMKVDFSNGKSYKKNLLCDSYGILSHELFRESCYRCNFKIDNSSADFLIGDFWGSEFVDKKYSNYLGTSSIICLNKEKEHYVNKLIGIVHPIDIKDVLRTNGAISSSAQKPADYDDCLAKLNSGTRLDEICRNNKGRIQKRILELMLFIKSITPYCLLRTIKRIKHRRANNIKTIYEYRRV